MHLDARVLTGEDNFQTKFLRVGNEIFIIGPDEKLSFHIELAKKEKIYARIEDLRTQNPDMLDGGKIYISGRVVRIGDVSTTLSLPLTEKGRKETIQVLKRKYPSFSIKEITEE